MSISRRIKQGFLRLPVSRKAILLSSGLLMVSAFLPWYDHRNAAGIGDTFLGIQGPLFLVGVLVAVFGAITFFNLFLPLMGKNFFKLRRKSGVVSMLLGAQAMFLLLIANSVFYHPEFGSSVAQKSTRFGMVVAFASLFVMVMAGWQANRKEKNGDFEDLDEMVIHEPEEAPVATAEPVYHAAPQQTVHAEPVRSYHAEPARDFSNHSYTAQRMRQSVSEESTTTPQNTQGVDPLTMSAKERYKMMRQRQRMSDAAKGNLWQGSGSNLPG